MDADILIVDDETMITSTLSSLIEMTLDYNVITYNDPLNALKSNKLNNGKIDLIITDFMMPEINGIEFLKKASIKSPESVRILLTGYADKENAIKSINEVGLYYYLEKPWDNNNLIKVIENGLEKKDLSDQLKQKYLELEESNNEIIRLYELLKKDYNQEVDNIKSLIISLANIIEAKDKYTDGHTRRVGIISKKLGERLGLSADKLNNLEIAGIIHDIGKVGVEEVILNKPDKLTDEEFEKIKKHTILGEKICKPLNCLNFCLDPVRHHHEKLDGTGYPDGLEKDDLSLPSRILAVADIFDALHSKRPYRDKLPLSKVKEIMIIEADEGKIDIKVVEELFKLLDENALDDILEQDTDAFL
ncbi:MAG: HD domain-containing phosphohydrolase [Halothermotrichaceae bacterium]